jgi:hypothetical protein
MAAMHRLSELERIADPDDNALGSIAYQRDCIKHLKKILKP